MTGETPHVRVVGVDCATQPGNVGVCLAAYEQGVLQVHSLFTCSAARSFAAEAGDWLRGAAHGIVALDAPLGWPQPLAHALGTHRAGAPIAEDANRMFRRETDRQIHRTLGKVPLEVGANLIARTALAALKDLQALRNVVQADIQLSWEPGVPDGIAAIEVYPAATVAAYKKLGLRLGAPAGVDADAFTSASHTRDAAICAIAAVDFLERRVGSPEPALVEIARLEGWVWVRSA